MSGLWVADGGWWVVCGGWVVSGLWWRVVVVIPIHLASLNDHFHVVTPKTAYRPPPTAPHSIARVTRGNVNMVLNTGDRSRIMEHVLSTTHSQSPMLSDTPAHNWSTREYIKRAPMRIVAVHCKSERSCLWQKDKEGERLMPVQETGDTGV